MGPNSQQSGDGALNPASIPLAQLARMLNVAPAVISDHVDAGAPANADGSINLIHYAAWLNSPGARRYDGDVNGD